MSHQIDVDYNDGSYSHQRIADLERDLATSHEERKAMFEHMGAENARLTAERDDARQERKVVLSYHDALKIECEGLHKLLTKAHGVVESAALGALSRSVDARRLFTILLEEMDAARKGGK